MAKNKTKKMPVRKPLVGKVGRIPFLPDGIGKKGNPTNKRGKKGRLR